MKGLRKNNVYYDTRYLNAGVVIFADNKKSFFKIFNDGHGFNNYFLTAKDCNVDMPEQEYRDIIFSAQKGKPLSDVFKDLHQTLNGGQIHSINKDKHGANHLKVNKTEDNYSLVFSKDIYGVKYATDSIDIYAGDHLTCSDYNALHKFYSNLKSIAILPNFDLMKTILDIKYQPEVTVYEK